ncbi:zinc finger BED domain-containing protein RICESLEEPER 2-like [Silene latifolia]|uniref:zinc finger BED domain-containing protein RICESLEEPER 2-like n=1 Tax=Silene latifolia TaxID=37657 RepID=UPI003D76C605
MTDLMMKTKSKIALTTDMWTSSNQKKGYMAVTAHFIDISWKLQSRILRFLYVEVPHTKDVLAEALCKCIYDWNLDCRIPSITLDNCTTNNGVMEIMRLKLPKDPQILKGKFIHMRCCAHILILIIQDGLSIIGEGIERVRNSVVFWTPSILRETKFESTSRSQGVNCSKKRVLDCKTRWNSTYEMLEVEIKYKKVFEVLGGQKSEIFNCPPLKED